MTRRTTFKRATLLVAVLSLALFAACSDDNDSEPLTDPGLPGPCVHRYLTPILKVTSATVAGSGAGIDSLYVTSVLLDGQSYSFESLLETTTTGVELVDGVLVGVVPFGFGILRGRYSITVVAPGLNSATVEVEAAYREFGGGCPSYNSGPTEVVVQLAEE